MGTFEGELNVMDLETQKSVYKYQGHNKIINSIDGCAGLNIGKGAPELVTGGRDGIL
jgi:hypothetical protein